MSRWIQTLSVPSFDMDTADQIKTVCRDISLNIRGLTYSVYTDRLNEIARSFDLLSQKDESLGDMEAMFNARMSSLYDVCDRARIWVEQQ